MKRILIAVVAVCAVLATSRLLAEESKGFSFKDTPGDHLDILLDGKIAGRFMYAHDESTPQRRLETYKPYLHVFDAEGKAPITKGPGGEYTHHRGIFIGWMKVTFDGKKYDAWHMPNSDIVTQKIVDEKASDDQASFTAIDHWIVHPEIDKKSKKVDHEKDVTIIEERRTMTFHRGPAPVRLTIDFTSDLKAPAGDLILDGDPEHAGIQFRPANEVDRAKTMYYFPVEKPVPHKDLDYPWMGETFTLGDHEYSIVDLNSPENPKGSRISAYRDYGRFGLFPKTEIKSGQTLVVKYRFLIADGKMIPAEAIERSFDQFTGASSPTPVPHMTELSAEHPSPKAQTPKKVAPKKPAAN
jgi:hypothetical protein